MRKVLLSRISFSALMLTFLTFIFLFFNFTSAGNWDKVKPSGNWDKVKPSGDQDLSTYVEGNMSAETYNETTITPTTNYSLSFDGVDDYVNLGNASQFHNFTQITLSAWFKTDAVGTARAIVHKRVDTNNRYGLTVGSNNRLYFTVSNTTISKDTISPSSVNNGQWQHALGVYNGTKTQLYLNGVLVKEEDFKGSISVPTSDLLIGRRDLSAGNYFNGSIDEVLIFNRSLNSTEISQLYNSGAGLYANTSIAPFNDGLVAGWHFDEGTGTTAYDITRKNNGTLVNGPTWVDGKISHNLTSTTETLGAKGLMPWVSATNFISTDFSLQWIGNTLKNPWFTSTELGNSTNRFNVFAWNLTADKYFSSDGTEGWTGNCVNASYKNGLVVGCND